MRPRVAAYSLIELLIVLLVLGVLAGVAAPRFSTAIAWQRLEAATRIIAADLRMARNEAVRTSSPIEVTFFPEEDRYAIQGIVDINHADRGYEQRLGDAKNAVSLIAADFSGALSVTFDIYGRPDSAGVVLVGYGSEQRQVAISDNGVVTLP